MGPDVAFLGPHHNSLGSFRAYFLCIVDVLGIFPLPCRHSEHIPHTHLHILHNFPTPVGPLPPIFPNLPLRDGVMDEATMGPHGVTPSQRQHLSKRTTPMPDTTPKPETAPKLETWPKSDIMPKSETARKSEPTLRSAGVPWGSLVSPQGPAPQSPRVTLGRWDDETKIRRSGV